MRTQIEISRRVGDVLERLVEMNRLASEEKKAQMYSHYLAEVRRAEEELAILKWVLESDCDAKDCFVHEVHQMPDVDETREWSQVEEFKQASVESLKALGGELQLQHDVDALNKQMGDE